MPVRFKVSPLRPIVPGVDEQKLAAIQPACPFDLSRQIPAELARGSPHATLSVFAKARSVVPIYECIRENCLSDTMMRTVQYVFPDMIIIHDDVRVAAVFLN